MDSKEEIIEVENRIRALTTILKNLNYHIMPSSDPQDGPPLWRHFATLVTTGNRKSPEANKVLAVTGSLPDADGKASTLVVAQNNFPDSDAGGLCLIENVLKSKKSLDQIVNR
jgi:hypothetical protein